MFEFNFTVGDNDTLFVVPESGLRVKNLHFDGSVPEESPFQREWKSRIKANLISQKVVCVRTDRS